MTFENVCKALAAPHRDGGDAASGPAEHVGRPHGGGAADGRLSSEPAVPRPGQMEEEEEEEGQGRRDPLKFQHNFKGQALNEVEAETLLRHTRAVLFTGQAIHNDDEEEEDEEEDEEDHEEEFSRKIAGGETQDEDAAAPSHVVQDADQDVPFHLVKFLKSALFGDFAQSIRWILNLLRIFGMCADASSHPCYPTLNPKA
jgi:hypothetical protein